MLGNKYEYFAYAWKETTRKWYYMAPKYGPALREEAVAVCVALLWGRGIEFRQFTGRTSSAGKEIGIVDIVKILRTRSRYGAKNSFESLLKSITMSHAGCSVALHDREGFSEELSGASAPPVPTLEKIRINGTPSGS
jgi:hypothetical protein